MGYLSQIWGNKTPVENQLGKGTSKWATCIGYKVLPHNLSSACRIDHAVSRGSGLDESVGESPERIGKNGATSSYI